MLPFNALKSVREQNISVADWSSRVDPGVGQPQLRHMQPVSGRHSVVPKHNAVAGQTRHAFQVSASYKATAMPNADDNFASWIRDIGTPDQGKPFSPAMTAGEPDTDHTPNQTSSPERTSPTMAKGVVDTTFHSVNTAEHRLDAAYFHLRTMGLAPDASWPQIMSRYQEILATFNMTQQMLPGQTAEVTRNRRRVNTAYACLRLLAARQS